MYFRASEFLAKLLVAGIAIAVAAEKTAVISDGQATQMKRWALLIAGSKGYEDYRHQADICHAYHVLRNHGIPDERIVVMMYDDIARNNENPTPGVIINHPKGTNVYPGVPKDYTGKLVTPKNFLDILQGKKVKGGSGKVIASGPKDNILINFVGHGGRGLILFPNGILYVRAFINAITDMHRQKFSKMVIYMESCYSGSMFDGFLPDNVNIYATTAANRSEPSYACYLDDYRNAYLGDAYSVKWMEDSDKQKDLRKETIIDQFKIVKKETTTSHVMQYGDLKIGKLPLSDFQGAKYAEPIVVPATPCFEVPSRDVSMTILWHKLRKASSPAAKRSIRRKLQLALRKRSFIDNKVAEIARKITENNEESTRELLIVTRPLRNFDCYERTVQHFSDNCFNLSKNPYGLGHLHVLVNMCEGDYGTQNITHAMDLACMHNCS